MNTAETQPKFHATTRVGILAGHYLKGSNKGTADVQQ